MRLPIALAALACPAAALAQPIVLQHSGYVLAADDTPLTQTTPLTFRIYDAATGGTLAWSSDPCSVAIRKGYFAVTLGADCNGTPALDATHLPAATVRFLEVSFDGVVLLPRLSLSAVPNAREASVAGEARALRLSTNAAAGRVLLSDAGGLGAWGQVGAAGLAVGAIADTHIASNAAISSTKIAGLGSLAAKSSIADADVAAGAAIASSKIAGLGSLAAKSSIADADVAAGAAIASSKIAGLGTLAAKSSIADADVAAGAAIAGSKISPNFGAQAVQTTGAASIGIASTAFGALRVQGQAIVGDGPSLVQGGETASFFDSYNTVQSAYFHPPKLLVRADSTRTVLHEAPVGLVVMNGGNTVGAWSKLAFAQREVAGAQGGGNTVSIAGIAAQSTQLVNNAWGTGDLVLWTKAQQVQSENLRIRGATGEIGIGTTTPQARLDVATGGIRMRSLGQITVQRDATVNTVVLPSFLDAAYVASHVGETFIYSDNGPTLKDTAGCGAGPNPSVRFSDEDASWRGQYIVTIDADARINLIWTGWQGVLRDNAGTAIATGMGRVEATLNGSGTDWRVQHMIGTVGNTNFSCY